MSSGGTGWIIFALLGIVLIFSAMSSAFRTTFNFLNILDDAAILAVMAVGETYVIVMAGIDLSVGSVLVFSGVAAAKVMGAASGASIAGTNAGWPIILVGILVGLAAGRNCLGLGQWTACS